MSEDRRLGEMMLEIMRAGFADVDGWQAAGEPPSPTWPTSIAVLDRLIAEDAQKAHRAIELLIDLMQMSLSQHQEDGTPPVA